MAIGRPRHQQQDRQSRRDETLRRILDAAWTLSREHGLTGWTLRDLGGAVGMRAPSLYSYVDSKNALYDLMFAHGYRALLSRVEATQRPDDPVALARLAAQTFVAFAVEDPPRFQLLHLRTIPGFEPSPESYALAVKSLDQLVEILADVGVTDPADVDLWTATLTGLASQQISNDPGGSRWSRLVDRAVDRLLPTAAQP